MKLFTNKKATQKITLILLIVILFNFLIPPPSKAVVEVGGDLLKELVNLFIGLGDVINGMMNHFFLGTEYMYGSAIFHCQLKIRNMTKEVIQQANQEHLVIRDML